MIVRGWEGVIATLVVAATPAALRAQELQFRGQYTDTVRHPDHYEVICTNGMRVWNDELEIRAERAVLLFDVDAASDLGTSAAGSGLPRRGMLAPPARRRNSEQVLRERLDGFLQALEGSDDRRVGPTPFSLGLLQSMYLEGGVIVIQNGREVARAETVHFSTVDDRTTLTGAELRFWPDEPGKPRVYVVRGDRLVRQSGRTVGRDVSVTTCIADQPHIEVGVDAIEIIERGNDFEIRTHDGKVVVGGVSLIPLPNTSFYMRDQTSIPIRGVTGGYSSVEGARAQLDLGSSFNDVGGGIHELLTGRPAHEFRGDWHLGLGYIEKRGEPIEGDLVYRADGLYRGRTSGFYLSDDGPIRREIRRELGGALIDERDRTLFHTENRVYLGERTTLDLTAFDASDEAVLPEFYRREYRGDERPETSAHLRHWSENRLLTVTGRTDVAGFSYADDRSLAPSFREELPLATLHVFSEPLFELPYDTPLLLTSASSAGYLRNELDHSLTGFEPETARYDQELELAAPFQLGSIGVRPFASGRATHYDKTVTGENDTRWAAAAGVRAGTRLARTWAWTGDSGRQALRHVVSPSIAYVDRFRVDGEPADFLQFDEVDAIDEGTAIRFELLNRLQHSDNGDVSQPVWLDLAQTLTPLTERDNNGHLLDLFEYELILQLPDAWSPLPNHRLLVEGEHDWNLHEERTFNVGTRFGQVLGFDWAVDYRDDNATDGSLHYGAATSVFDRWRLSAHSQYDFERNETTNYTTRIVRVDHDWRIHLGIVYDAIDDETRFFVNFEPTIGGLFQRRERDLIHGSVLDSDLGY